MLDFLKKMFGGEPEVDLATVIADGAMLVDVRSPQEFASGHVKGSVNIPLDSITHKLNKFKGQKNIIVFCQSGARSSRAAQILAANDIKNVYNGGSWMSMRKHVK